MHLIVEEDRPCIALDPDDPKCLACGAPIDPKQPLDCPDSVCGATYFRDGMPCMETWPLYPTEDDTSTPAVPALVSMNNGMTWDWCDQHREYEEDHPLAQRSCSYYADEARMLRAARDIYLSAPPEHSDLTYSEILARIDRNPFFEPHPA